MTPTLPLGTTPSTITPAFTKDSQMGGPALTSPSPNATLTGDPEPETPLSNKEIQLHLEAPHHQEFPTPQATLYHLVLLLELTSLQIRVLLGE